MSKVVQSAARMGGTYVQEVGEELAQQTIDITGNLLAIELSNELAGTDVDQTTFAAAVDNMKETLTSSLEALLPLVLILWRCAEKSVEPRDGNIDGCFVTHIVVASICWCDCV